MSEGTNTMRLSKVTKEFNLSLAKTVDFLNSKGFKIDSNPNAKIGDAEYNALVKEFSSDKSAKQEANTITQKTLSLRKDTVIIDDKKERTMFPDSGANSHLSKSDLPALDGIDAAYISGYALINPNSRANAVEILKELKSANIPMVIDPGTVGALRNIPMTEIKNWLTFADVLILNDEEARFLAGKDDLKDCLFELAKIVEVVVIKEGKKGLDFAMKVRKWRDQKGLTTLFE